MNGNAVIIGCGMAGLSAALHLARQNDCTIHLVSDMMSERSQSCLAEGGINAAIGPGDSRKAGSTPQSVRETPPNCISRKPWKQGAVLPMPRR